MRTDKLLAQSGLKLGTLKGANKSLFGLPISNSDANRVLKSGTVKRKTLFGSSDWSVMNENAETYLPAYFKIGKYKYMFINENGDVWYTETRFDPFV